MVKPSKVAMITAALHVEERIASNHSVADFIRRVLLLQHMGFAVEVVCIGYPSSLSRLKEDISQLLGAGIKRVYAKVFKGVFKRKRYPEAYEKQEKDLLEQLSGPYRFNTQYLLGDVHFWGLMCSSGYNSFKVAVDGNVFRCASVKGSYGNLYDGTFFPDARATPCNARRALAISQCHRFLCNTASQQGGESSNVA